MQTTLSLVIPCFNEEKTLEPCIKKVLELKDSSLLLDIVIVDDGSNDNSLEIARRLSNEFPEIRVVSQQKNCGKGAALRVGFEMAKGDIVAVQDADLEYDPQDLKKLIQPLIHDEADVVFGSRFLTGEMHRVLYFWHFMGNRFLTFLSNMFTDLNLTDMETCYKVFKREVIQSIRIEEERFGFEPEIVAKISRMNLRIYEAGISYRGRTYEDGKKIGVKDGLRALYCIFRYNAFQAPLPVQFLFYLLIGGSAALLNLVLFLIFYSIGITVYLAAPMAFIPAAIFNYFLCIQVVFRHRRQESLKREFFRFAILAAFLCLFDTMVTVWFLSMGYTPFSAKFFATAGGLFFNYFGRRYLVFS